MGRNPCLCCPNEPLNRGAWSALEDKLLTSYIESHGDGKWRTLPMKAGLKRCGKSCRLRWLNYLKPDLKRGNISHEEEDLIIRLHRLLGNMWSLIATRLPGRTDNEIKNYCKTTLAKKARHNALSKFRPKKPPSSATQHQVIRTKATRLTRKPVATSTSELAISNSLPRFKGSDDIEEVMDFGFLATHGGDDMGDYDIPFDDGILNEWTCDFDNYIASMDLEAVLLDCDEWFGSGK